jgi:limonene-1,2-epoxide hydrolase
MSSHLQQRASMTSAESAAFVTSFLASWEKRDLAHILSHFADDAVYHNVPVEPIVGLAAIRGIFNAFLEAFRSASLDVVTMASSPDLVLAERVDRFVLNDGRRVELPVTGVFVIRDRKIVRFSDYFDLASFARQSGMNL